MLCKQLLFSSILILVLFSFSLISSVAASSLMWNQTYGGTNPDKAYSLVETSDGGYAIAGYTTSFGAGNSDFWLVKTDADGNMLWTKTGGGSGTGYVRSLIETSDGGYAMAGHTYVFLVRLDDFWLIKTDATGNEQWQRTYGGAATFESAYSLVETSDGGYAIAGYTTPVGAGDDDCWLIKTDSNGYIQWNQTYGGTSKDVAYSLIETSDGGYAIAGQTESFGAGNSDFWLIKTDIHGNVEWNQTYGGAEAEYAQSLVETSDGGYAIAGYTTSFGAGNSDFWLVKTDANGNMEWNQTYGGTNPDKAYSLVETSDGGYAIAGYTTSFGAGNSDFWLIKTDIHGNVEWNQTYGGAEAEYAQSLVETSDGGYAIAGYTTSFGAGNSDFWLIKTDEMGNVPEFPSWLFLPLFLVATSFAVITKKKAFCRVKRTN